MSSRQNPNSPDWPRVFVAGSALAALGWFAWYWFDRSTAHAAPATPVPSFHIGASVKTGDGIFVDTSAIRAFVGPALAVTVNPVPMRVTFAEDRSASVMAALDAQMDARLPSGAPAVPVPRAAVVGTYTSSPMPAQPEAPTTPATPSQPPQGIRYLSDPMALRRGKRYRARLRLGAMEGAFATAGAVASSFVATGFENVSATDRHEELPTDWPLETTTDDQTRVWYVEGTWGREDMSVPRPPQVETAWEA